MGYQRCREPATKQNKNQQQEMANHKSSEKRIRQTEKRRLENHYWTKTARTYVRRIRRMTDKAEAQAAYNKTAALLDRLGRKNIISRNKAANLKSKLSKHINSLG